MARKVASKKKAKTTTKPAPRAEEFLKTPCRFGDAISYGFYVLKAVLQSHGFNHEGGTMNIKRNGPRGSGDTFTVTWKQTFKGDGTRIL